MEKKENANFKGVMLCNRPNFEANLLRNRPFVSRVDKKESLGINPIKKIPVNRPKKCKFSLKSPETPKNPKKNSRKHRDSQAQALAGRIQGKSQGNSRVAVFGWENAQFFEETRGFRSEKGRNREVLREKRGKTGKFIVLLRNPLNF